MNGLPDYTSTWAGTLNGVALNTRAWLWLNPRDLVAPMPRRGSTGIVVPRSDDEVPLGQRRGARSTSLRFLFVGECDPDGVLAANEEEQLMLNLLAFESAVFNYPTSTKTVPLTAVDPAGGAWAGGVQLLEFEWGDADTSQVMCRASLAVHLGKRPVRTAP